MLVSWNRRLRKTRRKQNVVPFTIRMLNEINSRPLRRKMWKLETCLRIFSPFCVLHSCPLRRASVHSVGSSGLLLRHPDRSVRPEPLQQEPDRAPSPRGGLRHGRGEGQPGQLRPLERAERLQPEPCPWQVPSYLRTPVQRSRYVSLP